MTGPAAALPGGRVSPLEQAVDAGCCGRAGPELYMLDHIYVMTYIYAMHADPEITFQMLADATRLRIVALLQAHGELCVCELTHALSLSQPKISRHLGQLRESGLVRSRRAGRWMYYAIHPDLPAWTRDVLRAACDGTEGLSLFGQDASSLAQMSNRPGAKCCA